MINNANCPSDINDIEFTYNVYNNSDNINNNTKYMSDDFMNIIPKVNCNYLNIDSIDIESNQGISIIHINARSVIKHVDDIIFLLDECKFKFNIIVITETWFQEINKDIYTIDKYNSIHVVRNNNGITNNNVGGGVYIFIQDDLIYNTLDNLCISIPNILDIVTISLNISNTNIIISVIYKSPKSNIINFSDFIYNNFNMLSVKNNLFLVGDFNVNILDINNNYNKHFINTIYSMGCFPLVTRPTRYGNTINSLIDNIYCNVNEKPISNGIIISDISDHTYLCYI